MNWHTVDETPPTAGEYLTTTISRLMIDAKRRVTLVSHTPRLRVYFDGVAWAHNGWTHWRKELGR